MQTTITRNPATQIIFQNTPAKPDLKQILPDWKAHGLSPKDAKFVVLYCTNGFDPGQAYIEATGKNLGEKAARSLGTRLLGAPPIAKAVTSVIGAWLAEKRVKLEQQIIESLYAQAFYDPSMFMELDGSPKFTSWDEIPKEYRCCVESIKTEHFPRGGSQTTIKMVDRRWALERLARYMALAAGANPSTITNNVLVLSSEGQQKLRNIFEGVDV